MMEPEASKGGNGSKHDNDSSEPDDRPAGNNERKKKMHVKETSKERKERWKEKHPKRYLTYYRQEISKLEKYLVKESNKLKQMKEVDEMLNKTTDSNSEPDPKLVKELGFNDLKPEERQKRITETQERIEWRKQLHDNKKLREKKLVEELKEFYEERNKNRFRQYYGYPPQEDIYDLDPRQGLSRATIGRVLKDLAGNGMNDDADAVLGMEVVMLLLKLIEDHIQDCKDKDENEKNLWMCTANMEIVKEHMQKAGIYPMPGSQTGTIWF